MKTKLGNTLSLISLALIALLINCCHHEASMEPNGPCIDNLPVEDTTRVYLWPISRDTLRIYPKMVFARFYPGMKDTIKIRQLVEKHHLRIQMISSLNAPYLMAWLCVTDGRRAEYHFTPYGKEGFCNFGADSLVEYAFGVFNEGSTYPSGNIIFKFVEGTRQPRIDSLFSANGLRFDHISPDFPTGKRYWTVVTPRSKKNVLDLTYELQTVPFAQYIDFSMFHGARLRCD